MSLHGDPVRRWWVFLRERYEPTRHIVMAAAFALGNAGLLAQVGGHRGSPGLLLLAGSVAVLFFLRLRIFDEIKDYTTDLVANPDRPLPRGVVSLGEARSAVWVVACAELALVALADPGAIPIWVAAFLFSVAMYREFWVGGWLRPRMELYALSHTLVAGLLGLTVCSMVLPGSVIALPPVVWAAAPLNWALFNVFEFSRKTFAPAEERSGVESYSLRWGPVGAVGLTLVWVPLALGAALWGQVAVAPVASPRAGAGVALLFCVLLALPFALRPTAGTARIFRVSMTGWAVLVYLSLGWNGLGGAG